MTNTNSYLVSKYLFLDVKYDAYKSKFEKINLISDNNKLEFVGSFDEVFNLLKKYTGEVYIFDSKLFYKSVFLNFPSVDISSILLLDISIAKALSNSESQKEIQLQIDSGNYNSLISHLELALLDRIKTLWFQVESPLTYILAKMELNGVYIDQKKLLDIQIELGNMIEELETSILLLIGKDININSTKQLGEVLVEKGYNLGKKGKSGNVSTDRDTLESLLIEDQLGLIKKLLVYRTITKLQSGFAIPLLNLVDKKTSRIHTTYDQTSVPTGRISSNSPNLQNIPIKDDIYGKKMRSCFSCEIGNILIGADYSQAELRFLAHFTQDDTLLEIFKSGQDVHARTAAEIFEIHIGDVTESQRRVGKTLNFALLYQQGTFSTAKQLGVTVKEAKEYTDRYFARFNKVKPFIEKTLAQATDEGYVETYSGRRRYFTNLKSTNHFLKTLDQRAAFNAVLQGSNADIIKLAMLGIEKRFETEEISYKLVLQVHDELVLEVSEGDKEKAKKILKQEMELGQPLYVPLEVDVGIGKDWSELK
jgi:DNA polymerase I